MSTEVARSVGRRGTRVVAHLDETLGLALLQGMHVGCQNESFCKEERIKGWGWR